MSYQLNYQAASYLAGVDLSSYQQQLVVLDATTGKVRPPVSAGEFAEGVLENAPLLNMPATVSYLGVTKVIVDGAYSVGTMLMAGYTGSNPGLATAATAPVFARLKMLESSAEYGDIVACRFVDSGVTGIQA